MTPLGIDPETLRLIAQRLNHYATPGPVVGSSLLIFEFVLKKMAFCKYTDADFHIWPSKPLNPASARKDNSPTSSKNA